MLTLISNLTEGDGVLKASLLLSDWSCLISKGLIHPIYT